MKFLIFFFALCYFLLTTIFSTTIMFNIFKPIFISNTVIFPFAAHPFNLCEKFPVSWEYMKLVYVLCFINSCILFNNFLYKKIIKPKLKIINKINKKNPYKNTLSMLIGSSKKSYIYLPEKSLFQNLLITGSIGSGKTSSAMYPFMEQLISYKTNSIMEKLAFLILDVKGNFCEQVEKCAEKFNRLDDLIIVQINDNFTYNPLDKPNLTPSVLANRLKSILLLFSPNNTESFWLDKVEEIFKEAIKLCRLYNSNYVTFEEIHKLINNFEYLSEKQILLRKMFQENKFSESQIYDLYSSISFFEYELKRLDARTLSILQSEANRITSFFISDYNIKKIFCPPKATKNTLNFIDVLQNGKIVVLNMNIATYKNLSKIIAAYLKIDFQSEIISQLSKKSFIRKTAFICDEYHEYITASDADFLSQSREAKSISIVATQSYSSLLNTIKENSTVNVILQNFINKLFFRNDDIFTIETFQKQIGKIYRSKISKSISENSNNTNYNFIVNSLNSTSSNFSESINSNVYFDFKFDTNYFTQKLENFSCLAFLSDGEKIIPPQKLNMFPFFKK